MKNLIVLSTGILFMLFTTQCDLMNSGCAEDASLPDLVADIDDLVENEFEIGDIVDFAVKIINLFDPESCDTQEAGANSQEFILFYRPNNTQPFQEIGHARYSTAPLLAGDSKEHTVSLTFNVDGEYYIQPSVDVDDTVIERNETNNKSMINVSDDRSNQGSKGVFFRVKAGKTSPGKQYFTPVTTDNLVKYTCKEAE